MKHHLTIKGTPVEVDEAGDVLRVFAEVADKDAISPEPRRALLGTITLRPTIKYEPATGVDPGLLMVVRDEWTKLGGR